MYKTKFVVGGNFHQNRLPSIGRVSLRLKLESWSLRSDSKTDLSFICNVFAASVSGISKGVVELISLLPFPCLAPS